MTTVKLRSMKADLRREAEGDWVPDRELPGVSYKVRSLHAPDYRLARAELNRKWQLKYRDGVVPPQVEDKEGGDLYCRYILLDWKGFDEPLTDDLREDVCTNPEWREVLNHIVMAAIDLGRPKIEFAEEAAGNSQEPSATS